MARETPRRQVGDIAKQAVKRGIYHGKLAEPYDGVGQYVLVSLSLGSVSAAYKARIAAGDFGTGTTFPVGTPVSISVHRGRVEILSLGNKRGAAMFAVTPRSFVIETDASWKVLRTTGGSPPAGWNEVGFDDSAWVAPVTNIGTAGLSMIRAGPDLFTPGDQCVGRREYEISEEDLNGADVTFKYAIDNSGTIYVNGVAVATLTGDSSANFTGDHATTLPRSYFQAGLNCIAIHIINESDGSVGNIPPGSYSGGAYIELRSLGTGSGSSSSGSGGGGSLPAPDNHGHAHNDLTGRTVAGTHPASAVSDANGGTVQDHIDDDSVHGGGSGSGITLGSITAGGSPSTLVNDAFHNAFVGLARLDANRIIAVWRKGDDHLTNGKIVAKIGTLNASRTDVSSWGSEFTIFDHSDDVRCEDSVAVVDGKVVIYARLYNGTANHSPFLLISDVKAHELTSSSTWTEVSVPLTHYSTQNVSQGHIHKLKNGRYLLGFDALSGTTRYNGVLLNDSLTDWSGMTRVEVGTGAAGYSEIAIQEMPDGTLRALLRSQTNENTDTATSTDHGATWSSISSAHSGYGYPAWCRLLSGNSLTVFRRSPNDDTDWRVSTDDGATWGTATVLDSTGTRSAYASLLQLTPEKVLCAYAVEYSTDGSTGGADIFTQIFTDASTGYTYLSELGGYEELIRYIDESENTGGVSDHGALTGLTDDDHTQYLTEGRHTALDHSTGGHYEVIVSGSPPVAVTNEAGDDWVYGWVSD